MPEDLRGRAVAAAEAGASRRSAAERFGVGAAAATRWVRVLRATGVLAAKKAAACACIEAFRDVVLGVAGRRVGSVAGQPCRMGIGKMVAFLGARRLGGMTAPPVLDGPTSGPALAYAEQVPAPTLRPGGTATMDLRKPLHDFADLPARKAAGVRAVTEAAGLHMRRLSPCSPDFNPIRQAFAKLKALLRRVAARTIPDLRAAIANALARFAHAGCANHFAACGHEPGWTEFALKHFAG